MVARTLIIAVFAGTIATGCGKTADESKTARGCTNPECQVQVTVVNGAPKADPETLEINANNHGPGGNGVRIVWHVSGDYTFKDDGIRPKDDSAAGWSSQFSGPGTGGSGKQFHWTDKNTDNNLYKYKITVYDKGGNPLSSDPGIQNGVQ